MFAAALAHAAAPGLLMLVSTTGQVASRKSRAALGRVRSYPAIGLAMDEAERQRSGLGRVSLSLVRSLAAPGQARDAVAVACREWRLDHLTTNAQLVVSELVTNAVTHAGTDAQLEIIRRQQFLHLRVHDGSPVAPVMTSRIEPLRAGPAGQPLPDHGRGLPIVQLLCSGWGFMINSRGDGKVVWATLRLRPVKPPSGRGATAAPVTSAQTEADRAVGLT